MPSEFYNSCAIVISEPWTVDHEKRLREHVSRLKQERSTIQGTFVSLESTHLENMPIVPASTQEIRKMDLEMAVLLQVRIYVLINIIFFKI